MVAGSDHVVGKAWIKHLMSTMKGLLFVCVVLSTGSVFSSAATTGKLFKCPITGGQFLAELRGNTGLFQTSKKL